MTCMEYKSLLYNIYRRIRLNFYLTSDGYITYYCMNTTHHPLSAMKDPKKNKIQQLKNSRTMNPRADKVQDLRFTQLTEFFDSQDLLQVRYEMVRLVLFEDQTLAQAASRFGLSRPTCYRMTRAFRQGGLQALIPAPLGPQRAHKITPEILRFVLDYRAQHGRVGARKLVPIVKQKFGVQMHPRGLEKALVRWQKKTLEKAS